jgi:hypothetical protein
MLGRRKLVCTDLQALLVNQKVSSSKNTDGTKLIPVSSCGALEWYPAIPKARATCSFVQKGGTLSNRASALYDADYNLEPFHVQLSNQTLFKNVEFPQPLAAVESKGEAISIYHDMWWKGAARSSEERIGTGNQIMAEQFALCLPHLRLSTISSL